jgi:cell division protein FtsB
MGAGRTDSVRWQLDRPLSGRDTARRVLNDYWQLKAERDFQANQNERLALRVAALERELNEYRQTFGPVGFNIPEEQQ